MERKRSRANKAKKRGKESGREAKRREEREMHESGMRGREKQK